MCFRSARCCGSSRWGRQLFEPCENEFSRLHAVEKAKVPRPSTLVPDYSPQLEEIVMKALSRDRTVRYQSALEMRIALEEFAYDTHLAVSSAKVSHMMDKLFPAAEREGSTGPGSSLVSARIDPTPPGPGELTKPTGPAAPTTGRTTRPPARGGQRTLGPGGADPRGDGAGDRGAVARGQESARGAVRRWAVRWGRSGRRPVRRRRVRSRTGEETKSRTGRRGDPGGRARSQGARPRGGAG